VRAVRGIIGHAGSIGCLVGIIIGLASATSPAAADEAPRRVYVLHPGIRLVVSRYGKNAHAEQLRQELLQRGIADRDIVVLENPYPAASVQDVFARESATMFLESARPASETAQQGYGRFDRVLRERGVTPRDEIFWIGHSAGGQMGMTLAHLAHRLEDYPELARTTRPYRFCMVVTLGTPVAANHVPGDVPLRHYHSAADTVVGMLTRHGAVVRTALGLDLMLLPCSNVGPNVKVRVFPGIRHHQWCWTPRVVDAILAESADEAAYRCCADSPATHGLAQLLALGLEEAIGLSFEE
jgi:hypothetical protein